MSTFNQGNAGRNAREKQASAPKDNPTAEEVQDAEKTAADTEGSGEVPASNPGEPNAILNESEAEAEDRHVASTELPVEDVTDPDTQADTAVAEDAGEKIVAGAAAGPFPDGTVVNDQGNVAYAPPGSYNAAMNGVQEDAAGHVDSVGTDNSSRSNTRI